LNSAICLRGKGEMISCVQRTAAIVTVAFSRQDVEMSHAGLKSGTLSVEKVKGARIMSMRMSACENCFRIERP